MIYTGLVFFMVGVIIAAVANNFTTLLVGRSIQGIGGGGLIALTEIVVTDLVPMRFRGQWFGIISGMWAIGSVSGPVIGGALSQNASWVRFLKPMSKLWQIILMIHRDGSSGSTCHLLVLPLSLFLSFSS